MTIKLFHRYLETLFNNCIELHIIATQPVESHTLDEMCNSELNRVSDTLAAEC